MEFTKQSIHLRRRIALPYHLVRLVPLMLDPVKVDIGDWFVHAKRAVKVDLP